MVVIGEETGWFSSTAASAQKKVHSCKDRIVRTCSRQVHPDGCVLSGSKVGDVPDEPRQWCAFEFADIMEQGLSGGITGSFIEVPAEEQRLCVERSPDRKEFLLTNADGTHLLIARLNDNDQGFSIFVTTGDGDPPKALGPAFTLMPNSAKDRWTLHAKNCDQCESRGKRLCGSRELAYISHHKQDVGQGQVCCMEMEIPAVTQEGSMDVWCPMCKAGDTDQQYAELTTRMPTWNARRKTLSLDFHGRCNLASSKNFQLEVVGKPEKHKLLFGKVGTNQFVLDYNRPIGMVQAFAAAVSTTVWK